VSDDMAEARFAQNKFSTIKLSQKNNFPCTLQNGWYKP